MSAWIVTKGHIDCLVQSLAVEGLIEFDQATDVGKLLWRENHRSVNARYGERGRTPSYAFRGVEAPLDPAVVFKQVACYQYQSCEHGGWTESRAYRLTEALGEKMLAQLGQTRETVHRGPAWDAAPWGIDRIEQAISRGEFG